MVLGERGRLADVMAKVHDLFCCTYNSFTVLETGELGGEKRILKRTRYKCSSIVRAPLSANGWRF